MDAAGRSCSAEQLRDLNQVADLWRKVGHTPLSVYGYRLCTLKILQAAQTCDYRELTAERVVQWAGVFARRRHLRSAYTTRRHWLSVFRAFAWGLQQLGKPVGSIALSRRIAPVEAVLTAFTRYGQKLGWKEPTLQSHLLYLRYLRRFLLQSHAPWPVPRLKDVDHFLYRASKRWQRTTVASAAISCRAWLRFLFVSGRTKHNLASSIALPPAIPFPQPARALPWTTVRQLRRGIDRSTAIGQRDYAQYLLFCAYGLSNAEVINLRLEDIDWNAGVLHIRRLKNGATVDLPMLPAVAQAIATYLRHGRPHTAWRHVFVRHTIPFGPLGRSSVGWRVRWWAKRAQVKAPFLGVHLFRHSFATHQLELGTPLKVIGDILGHRDSESTEIYVRSALGRLRQLALPVPV